MGGPGDASPSDEAIGASMPTMRLGPQQDISTDPRPREQSRKGHVEKDMNRDELLPARIGRFAVEAKLGTGGMGVVYRAEDRQLGRKVAIKVLRHAAPSDDSDDGGEAAQRLRREAQALAKLGHPNVVTVHDVDEIGDAVYVVMELIEGETLRRWMTRAGPRPWREVLAAFVQAGRGLAAAHGAGLVHRDFKPENVMIDGQGRVRVLDFGLARSVGLGPPSSLVARLLTSGAAGSALSMVAGTPPYMAPEQHLGLPCDARSDQFSFCVALYEALHGVRPFPDGDPAHRFRVVMAGDLRRPPRPAKVPGWLRAAIERGLSAVPNKRHDSMDALLDAITRAPKVRRRRLVAAAIAVPLLTAAALGWSLWVETRDLCQDHAERVTALWAAHREPLQAAILESKVPYAAETWKTLDAVLDERGRRWGELYAATCGAHERAAPEAQDGLMARMTCLHGQARELAAMLAAMAEEPESAARQAVKVADQLDPVAACGKVESLPSWGRSPDAHATMRGEQIRRVLADVKIAAEFGRYRPALARAETALGEARGLGEPALIAEALLRIGNLHRALNDFARAAATVEDAHWMALGAGVDDIAVEAANSLILVHGHHRHERELGRLWERSAAALLRRLPERPRYAAVFYNNRAVVRVGQGRHDEAAADYRRALEIFEQEGTADSAKVALVLSNMSRLQFIRGDLAAAAAGLERALQIRERKFGGDHPETALVLSNLAIVLTEMGALERAITLLRRALAIEETMYGPRHVKLAPTLDNLAKALARQGEWDDAGRLSQRALALLQDAERLDPGVMADVRIGIGVALALQGRFDEALPELRQAVALREQHGGVDHPEAILARAELAEVLLLAGDAEGAFALLGNSLPESTTAQIAAYQSLRARVLLALGTDESVELVRPLLTRALPDLPAPLTRGRARAALARLLGTRGEAGAAELAALAADDLRAAGPGFERERAAIAAYRPTRGADTPAGP